MKLINKNVDYAARALLVMSKTGGAFISARDIAAAQKIPYHFLRRVLQPLIKNGIVASVEGTKGGFKLLVHPAKLSILKLISIYNGKFQLSECMFRGKPCSNRRTCVLRKEVVKIENDFAERLGKLTISKLLQK
jgi:Rrf2 family protein